MSQDLDVEFAAALNTALQMHDKTAHTQTAPTKLKLKPPTVGSGCTPDQWSSFTRQWEMYKAGMAIADNQVSTALFYCCEDELKTDLMRDLQTDVATMNENDLLAAIKCLAVKDESILVHRIKLSKMTQAPGTSIRTFLASLRGQAALCQYIANCNVPGCTHKYNYSEEIIKDNLVRGIADPEILSDLLGDPKTDRTLDETVSFITQKEQGKVTRSAVGDCTAAIGHPTKNVKSFTEGAKCWACGKTRHGPRNDRNTRSKLCPAWTSTCARCSVKGHYTSSCSKCTNCGAWGHRDKASRFCPHNVKHRDSNSNGKKSNTYQTEDQNEDKDSAGFLYDQLCATHPVEEQPNPTNSKSKPLDHHVYDGRWVARPSKPHPVMTVQLTPLPDDHHILGHPMKRTSALTSISIPMIADSGCQSSIIPLRSALAMGIDLPDIFPVKLTMRGAIEEDLAVVGGVVAEVSTSDICGNIRKTKQLIYVSRKIDKAFLCREALIALGVISVDFPTVPAALPQDSISLIETTGSSKCSCPIRDPNPPPMPKNLPPGLSATEKDVPALRQWLLDYYGATTFNTCEHQPLPMMNCEPLRLHVDPNAKPVAFHKPALVPIHWQDQVFKDLERDVQIGVLEKVSPNTPVTWCSRMVVTAKADGTPRRTVDLQPQNRHSVRQTHHVPSPFHLADRVPQNTKKTVTDAWNGYHSVPICEEDRHITTFITPWGRYRYKVAPQGFLASGDAYNQRFDAIIANFGNKVKCVDDTCMWADSIESAFSQACEWLDLCARNGITLNPKKFQFAQDNVEFAGLTITSSNVRPSAKFLNSIKNFPRPTDISGARAWFGLVNQGAYAFSMAKQMKPFRHLLKPSTKFVWTDELEHAFEMSRDVIINEIKEGVRLFDPSRQSCLTTDWSEDGIGFFLMQKYCQCKARTPVCCKDGWKLCLVGSRFTKTAESRYAPIEGEALAVAYALHQTRYYVMGCEDLLVATDHKPLVKILNDRSLTDIDNRRLLNLKEKTLPYRFTIVHVPGNKNQGADAVSRHPVVKADIHHLEIDEPSKDAFDDLDLAEDGATALLISDTLNAITNIVSWDMVREATASDDLSSKLITAIREGFPEKCKDMAPELRPYHRVAGSLCCVDGVILMGQRVVIPISLRPSILDALHAAHQGVNAMCARAADSVYWPNMTTDITRTRDECSYCHRIAKSNPMQPPSDITPPEYPFQRICSDYFSYNNKDYIVVVDRYSNWPMVFLAESGAEGLVKRLREVFVTFGVPEELTSDGGPQFTAGRTREFLKSWSVHHRITSVANPHANCRAEIAVKTVKRMLMDNTGPTGSLDIDKFQRAMLVYRNAIDPETRASPALILFGRPIRDPIPIPMGRYCPHSTWQETRINREKALAKRHSREHEKWSEHTHLLPPLKVGDHVYVQNLLGNHPRRWERTGVVVEVRQFHQYVVKIDGSGRVTLRNRQHLRKFTPFKQSLSDSVIEQTVTRADQQIVNKPTLPQAPPTEPQLPPASPNTSFGGNPILSDPQSCSNQQKSPSHISFATEPPLPPSPPSSPLVTSVGTAPDAHPSSDRKLPRALA